MNSFYLRKAEVISSHFRTMGFLNAIFYIFQRAFKRNGYLTARVKNCPFPIYLRNDRYDTQIFTQIFVRRELDVYLDFSPSTIIDGGANIGLATLYLKTHYPEATIISVEPESSNFNLLKKNTANLRNVFILQAGIWNSDCYLKVIDTGNGHASFITEELATNVDEPNAIKAVTIGSICKQYNLDSLDLVKLDIEGAENEVFDSNYEEWLNKTQSILVEIHPHLRAEAHDKIHSVLQQHFAKSIAGEYCFFTRK